jgi:hypothetical protein
VRDGQTSPHRPRLVVSRSTCPPISPPPPCKQLCTRSCSNKHTHTVFASSFSKAHRETAANFHASGLPSQQNRSDNAFRFKHEAFYMGLKSKVGLVSAKASALRINLNIQDCSVVAPPLHAPPHAPLLLPPPPSPRTAL